ncbi:hypothetical protein ACNOYE_16375 [Nannocystaceae bacterium ST9]
MRTRSRILGLLLLTATACVDPDSGDDVGDDADDGEEIGGALCPDPRQGLLAFDVSGGALSSTTYPLPPADWQLTGALGSGDFDGDGSTDLVIGPQIVFGPISASSEHVALDVGELTYHGALAVDLDDDGRDELVLGLMRELDSTPHARLFAVSATREIEALELPVWSDNPGSGRLSFAAGDVSGDGLTDLVFGTAHFGLASETGEFAVFVGDGARGFAEQVEILEYAAPNFAGHSVVSLALADLDGVGGLDILSTHAISSYSGSKPDDFILETTDVLANPTFVRSDQGYALRAATFADVTQDGRADVVAWEWQVYVAPGHESGGFDPEVLAFESDVQAFAPTMIVTDLDQDALPDLLIAPSEGDYPLALARGQAGGTLAEPVFAQAPGFDGVLSGGTVSDIDDDGTPEIVALGHWCGVSVD